MPFSFNRSWLEGILCSIQGCWVLSGSFSYWNWELTIISNMVLWFFVALILREYRREAVLVHWMDPKPLLRSLLHCHSHCSYCQRGMGPSRCSLPCPSWPSAGGPALILWTAWECALCSTQVGWRLVSELSAGSGCPWAYPRVRLSLCSVLVNAGRATKLSRGDTASGLWAVHWYLGGCSGAHLHITGFVAVLGISSNYSPFPWSPYRLNPC